MSTRALIGVRRHPVGQGITCTEHPARHSRGQTDRARAYVEGGISRTCLSDALFHAFTGRALHAIFHDTDR